MKYATKYRRTQVLFWLIWGVACLVFLVYPGAGYQQTQPGLERPALECTASSAGGERQIFWRPQQRLRKWAWRQYCKLYQAHQKALWVAQMSRLAMQGALTMGQVVGWMIQSQEVLQVGALPVMYGLLEKLEVRQIINRMCSTRSPVDHGVVVVVLVLNRLIMPLPLYEVSQWVAKTGLEKVLGIPAEKFNDDRLGRTLTALSPHCETIWQEIIQRALVKAKVDIKEVAHDLTAYITYGVHKGSKLIDFGFAHSTPMKLRKCKLELNASMDGGTPVLYKLWNGRTGDDTTVAGNMESLSKMIAPCNHGVVDILLAGDRANLNDELALAYDDNKLRYLAGLRVLKKIHKRVLSSIKEKRIYANRDNLLTDKPGPTGYWGVPCAVPFQHEQRSTTHRGLIVISGPMRNALRQKRAQELKKLRQQLSELEGKIGAKPLTTVKSVQRRANQLVKASPVGMLMSVIVFQYVPGQIKLRWRIKSRLLKSLMAMDGRYLLVTNDKTISAKEMFFTYHRKDAVEKCFHVSKHDLKVSPLYLHKDDRITSMMLVNMLALLCYRLLQRQSRLHGLSLTTRQIIAKLERLSIIETRCPDGSRIYRWAPLDTQQEQLVHLLAEILAELPHFAPTLMYFPAPNTSPSPPKTMPAATVAC